MVFLNLSRDGRVPHGFLLSHAHYTRHRVSLSYGHPCMIDVNDCDARLPSSGSPHDLYVDELVRLSIILGRVLKTIYRYMIFLIPLPNDAYLMNLARPG